MDNFAPDFATPACPHIWLDTDMGNDVDDALALTMLHAMQRRGQCRLIGVSVSKDNSWAAPYTQRVNARCGAPELPVGVVQGGATADEGPFIGRLCREDAARPAREPGRWPEAVGLLRKTLATQPDASVVIVSIGFYTNLSRLLNSKADAHSPLDGRALIARKVAWVCSMAGNFNPKPEESGGPDMGNPEFNIRTDIPAAVNFINGCPRPIVFSGFEIGANIRFPGAAVEKLLAVDPENPVAKAYALYLPMPYDRQCWDQTAVLYAVRPTAGYFDLSERGRAVIDDSGYSTFAPHSGGLHRHLALNERSQREALEEITRLSCEFA